MNEFLLIIKKHYLLVYLVLVSFNYQRLSKKGCLWAKLPTKWNISQCVLMQPCIQAVCSDQSIKHPSEDSCSFMPKEIAERCFHLTKEDPELKWKDVLLTILFCQCLSFSTYRRFHLQPEFNLKYIKSLPWLISRKLEAHSITAFLIFPIFESSICKVISIYTSSHTKMLQDLVI